MTLEELMNKADDETWFCIVTPDGKEHVFWNADYIGGDPDVMQELEPLLGRQFDEFGLIVRQNPEVPREDVPMVWVGVLMTEDELKQGGEE